MLKCVLYILLTSLQYTDTVIQLDYRGIDLASTDIKIVSNEKKGSILKAISQEKNERVARTSLHDIMIFQQSMEKEIKKLEQSGTDTDLLKRMMKVKDHYQKVKFSFAGTDDENLRHSFIAYADALQDLITHIYRRRQG